MLRDPNSTNPSKERARKVYFEHMREALEVARGNIKFASLILDISLAHTNRLVKNYKLNDYARTIRLQTGANATGRPFTSMHPKKRKPPKIIP